MVNQPLSLSIALSDNSRTRPIIEGRVGPDGCTLTPTVLHPSEMFWRQLKFEEFDVSEMSLSSLTVASAKGPTPWVAIPVFTTRYFFQTWMLVNTDKIKQPSDLKGKRMGVPEYQQTAALWSRGILQHEYGVHARDMEWFMERLPERSHGGATGFQAPEGVKFHYIPSTTDIGEMMLKNELDATMLYIRDANAVDRSKADLSQTPNIRPLFPGFVETKRYYEKTGLYPINHCVVLRRSLHEKYPWLALNLYHMFNTAKAEARKVAESILLGYHETGLAPDVLDRFGKDPTAYGMKANRKVVETAMQYVHEQGLSSRRVTVEEVFAPSTLDV